MQNRPRPLPRITIHEQVTEPLTLPWMLQCSCRARHALIELCGAPTEPIPKSMPALDGRGRPYLMVWKPRNPNYPTLLLISELVTTYHKITQSYPAEIMLD